MTKADWISYFRDESDKVISDLNQTKKSRNDKASAVNKSITALRDMQIEKVKSNARIRTYSGVISGGDLSRIRQTTDILLNEMLTITYASYIVMLEARNKVWPYEYMAFARRIGELWEPFCKMPFYYPVNPLQIIEPPDFEQVQNRIKKSAVDYINGLQLSNEIKAELKRQYAIPWTMVDSGGIKLGLDLHFE